MAYSAPPLQVGEAARPVGGGAPLLRVSCVVVRFGGVIALAGVSFDVQEGEICGLIGPNGSGKTTLFNCISGIYHYQPGEIAFEGRKLGGVRRHRIAGLGIGRTFQNVALFRSMTVRDNVLAGAHSLARTGFIANALRLGGVEREEERAEEKLSELLSLLDLQSVAAMAAGSLPFATKKRVELARALMGNPKLLLLDEPAGGLNHAEVEQLEQLLRALRMRFRVSILLVEHHMNLVMRVSDRVVALEQGKKIAEGTPDEVRRNPEVVRSYLGESEREGAA